MKSILFQRPTRSAVLAGFAMLFAGLGIPISAHPAHASVVLNGAGSTWSAIAVDQWRADVSRSGLNINFNAVGSTAGRTFYIQKQVDFAA